jgi:hypothetical protein
MIALETFGTNFDEWEGIVMLRQSQALREHLCG